MLLVETPPTIICRPTGPSTCGSGRPEGRAERGEVTVGDPISREEHEEFVKRMEGDHKRIDKRLALLEESVRQIGALTTSVEKLAMAVEAMGRTLSAQGNRLETLEGRDGKRWRQLMGYVLTAVVSVLVGFAATRLGLT